MKPPLNKMTRPRGYAQVAAPEPLPRGNNGLPYHEWLAQRAQKGKPATACTNGNYFRRRKKA